MCLTFYSENVTPLHTSSLSLLPPPPALCGICGISEGEKEGKYHPAVFEVSLLPASWPAGYSIYIMRNFTPLTQGSLSL